MTTARKRVAVFISGGGSNMLALAHACAAADFPAEIVGVFSDKADAGGLAKAEALGIPTFAFPRKHYGSKDEHEAAILASLDALHPDILCLAGYMRLLSGLFIQRYEGRMINIHPSLLPCFPGLHTHQRAIDAGHARSGCTVHFVTEGMDEGPVIAQASVPIVAGDTAETLAARVLTVEHKAYPLALRLFAADRVAMVDGRTVFADAAAEAEAARLLTAHSAI